jgi:hypothetical protein
MKKLLGSLALSLGLMAGNAAAADIAKLYYGIGFTDGSIELASDNDKSLGTINATLGFQLLDFVGLELEVGAASDQTGSILSEPLVQYQAAMVRLGYRWDRAGVYVLGGQARLDVDRSLNTTDAGTAVGAGINLFGNKTTALNLHFLSIDGGTFTTASIGFQYYFGGFR